MKQKRNLQNILIKKPKNTLDNFRQRLKTVNEDQKEEIIKKSIKKLIQNGALEYEEFKNIIAESIGFRRIIT